MTWLAVLANINLLTYQINISDFQINVSQSDFLIIHNMRDSQRFLSLILLLKRESFLF